MENTYAVLLAFLEMTFTFVSLALLHSQRKIIGSSVFYISVGLLFLFMQFVSAAAIRISVGIYGLEFYIGSTVLFLPYLAALLLVYLTEGTLAAQRMIVGVIIAFGMFFYLVTLTRLQCDWMGFAISQGIASDSLQYLLNSARTSITGSTLAQIMDLFLLAIIFQRLRNAKCNLFICILGALICTCIIDSFVYLKVTVSVQSFWWVNINNSFFIKTIASTWLAFLITVYMYKIEKNIDVQERSSLDIVFAFFGGYGKAKALERDLREWEGRYRMVVENASEAIFILDDSGQIIDANLAAIEVMGGNNVSDVLGAKLLHILQDENVHFVPFVRNVRFGLFAARGSAPGDGGRLRGPRVMYDNAIDLDDTGLANQSFTRMRTSVGLDYKPLNNLEFKVKLTHEFRYYFTPKLVDFHANEIMLDQLYVKLKLNKFVPGVLTVGRQNIMLGEGFVILDGHPGDGSRSAYFNAIRYDWNIKENHTLTGFFAYQPEEDFIPTINGKDIDAAFQGDNSFQLIEQSERVAALYYNGDIRKINLHTYGIWKEILFDGLQRTPHSNIYTAGARVKIPFSGQQTLSPSISLITETSGLFSQNAAALSGQLEFTGIIDHPGGKWISFEGYFIQP